MLEPLGTELHLLIKVDPDKFPQEMSPLEIEEAENGQENGNSKSKESAYMMSTPEIDILVVYTQQAAAQSEDIEAVIFGAEDISNQSFANSNISATINVVHTAQVGYNESGNIELDLCRITTSPSYSSGFCDFVYGSQNVSGFMDYVHDWRDEHAADLVVLLVDHGGAGVAWQNSNVNTAFSVVRWDLAVGNYTFAHEIGHNLGAHHDQDNGTNTHFPYGHGYRYLPANWRTIMAYPPGDRINYWSNPNVTLGGVAMGTTQNEDNARVWNERAQTVADFKDPPNPDFFSVQIMGDFYFGAGNFGQWFGHASEGEPPYSFTWFRSYSSSSGPWTQVGTGSSYSQVVNQDKWLRLTATDSDCNPFCSVTADTVHIQVDSCHNPPCPMPKAPGGGEAVPEAFALSQNYPNPFNPSTTISYDLPEQADVRMEVFNMLGQRVALLVDGQVQTGSHTAVFDASNLSSGTYLLRLDAQGGSGTRFNRTMGMQLVK